MEFKRKYLKKYLSNFGDGHPVIKIMKLRPNTKKYYNELLKDLDKVVGLRNKIKELKKDEDNFKGYLAELKFCREVLKFKPKFISSKTKCPSPDILAHISGVDVSFEIKNLIENDKEEKYISEKIRNIKSDYFVIITYNYIKIGKEQSEKLIDFVKSLINQKSTGTFIIMDGNFEIKIAKESRDEGKRMPRGTTIILFPMYGIKVNKEKLIEKILSDFYEKSDQFKASNPIFWVLYIEKRKYQTDNIEQIFYEKNTENSEEDGLFFTHKHDFAILNGVIIVYRCNELDLIINPFAKNQINNSVFRKLENLCANIKVDG